MRRELIEELSATFTVGELVETVRWEYPDRTVVLYFFACQLESGDIVPREQQADGGWSRPSWPTTISRRPTASSSQRLAR